MNDDAYTPEFVERGYNNRAAVPDHPRWLAHYPERRRKRARRSRRKLDLRYGPGPKETLDLFLPPRPRARHVRVPARRLLARVRQERFLVRRAAVRRRRASRSPSSTTICVRTCRSRRSSTNAGARSTGSSREGAGARRERRASSSADIRPAGTSPRCCYATDWAALRLRRAIRSSAACRCRACTTSRRWCSSRTTPISSSTTPRRHALSPVRSALRGRARLSLLAAGADETSEFVRQTQILWDAWPRTGPPAARVRC